MTGKPQAALVAGAALAAGLALWTGCGNGPSEPITDVSVSDNTPGISANLTIDSSLPGGDDLLRSLIVRVPDGWTIEDAPDGDVVGSGFLELDLDCDGSPNDFNFDLVRQQPPGAEVTAWGAEIPGFMDLLFRVEPLSSGGYEIGVTFPWDFFPDIVACTPETVNFTANGTDNSGAPIVANPSPDGAYTFRMTYGSQPAGNPLIREDCVAIGTGVCPTEEQSQ